MDQKNKAEFMLFGSQITLIFIVVLASLFNLSFQCGDQQLWMIVLTSCLGYILPNPKLKLTNFYEKNKDILRSESNSNNFQNVTL